MRAWPAWLMALAWKAMGMTRLLTSDDYSFFAAAFAGGTAWIAVAILLERRNI